MSNHEEKYNFKAQVNYSGESENKYKKTTNYERRVKQKSSITKRFNEDVTHRINLLFNHFWKNQFKINDLNGVCLLQIFQFLEKEDRVNAKQVCRRWNRLIQEPHYVLKKAKVKNTNPSNIKSCVIVDFNITDENLMSKKKISSREPICDIEEGHNSNQSRIRLYSQVYICPIYSCCILGITLLILILNLYRIVFSF